MGFWGGGSCKEPQNTDNGITARGQQSSARWGSCTRTRQSGTARLLHPMTIQNDCGMHFKAYWLSPRATTPALTQQMIASHFSRTRSILFCPCVHYDNTPYDVPSRSTPTLENWTPVTTDELEKLIGSAPCKTCQLDLVPTWLVKNMKALWSPFVTLLFNKSQAVSVGCFPSDFKEAVVRPLLKKTGSDTSRMKIFRPVSNLSFLSKLLERIMQKQHEILDSSNLMPIARSTTTYSWLLIRVMSLPLDLTACRFRHCWLRPSDASTWTPVWSPRCCPPVLSSYLLDRSFQVVYGGSTSPSGLTSASTSTFQTRSRAFTGLGRFEEFVLRLTLSLHAKTRLCLIPCWRLQHRACRVVKGHTTDRLQCVLNAATQVVSRTHKFDRGLTHLLHSELHWLDVP